MKYRKTITKEEKQEIKDTLIDIILSYSSLLVIKDRLNLTKGLDLIRKREEAKLCSRINHLIQFNLQLENDAIDIRVYRKFLENTLTKTLANAIYYFDDCNDHFKTNITSICCYCANCYDDAKMAMIAGTICNNYDLLCFLGLRKGKNLRSDYYIHEHT